MTSEYLRRWREAERHAHEAAIRLQAVLRIPGRLPENELFERLRLCRAAADTALQAFVTACAKESRAVQGLKPTVRHRGRR